MMAAGHSNLLSRFFSSAGAAIALMVLGSACNPLGDAQKVDSTFLPGLTLSTANSVVSVASASVSSGGTVLVTLTLKDQNSNVLKLPGVSVAFSNSGGTSTGTFGVVVDNGDGTYSAPFLGIAAGSATTISATANGEAITSTAPTLVVTPGNYSLSNSTIALSASTVVATASITATLTVRDAANNPLSSGGLAVAFSNSDGSSTGTFSAVNDHFDGTYSVPFIGLIGGTPTSIHATIQGSPVTSTAPTVTVVGGSANGIAISSGSGASGVVATSTPFVAIVTDVNGNPLQNATVNWAVSGGGGSLSSASNLTNSSGLSSNTLTLGNLIGTNTVTATVQGTSLVATFTATGTHAAASQIVFATQPGGGTAGAAWSTQPIVQVKDAYGNLVTTGADATRTISVALTTGTGALTGTLTKTAVGGVADFSVNALKIDLSGTNKVLTASTTITAGAVTVASSSFTVTHAAASQIAVTAISASTVALIPFASQPIVTIQDAFGNTVTTGADATAAITLTLQQGTGSLAGTSLSMNAVAGVANFSGKGLNVDLVGTNKIIRASKASTVGGGGVGILTGDSATFTITHGQASVLVFATQPGGGTSAVAWSTQPIVEIRDAFGNLITTGADATRTITVALTTGTGALTGTLTKTAVAGVADFSANALKVDLTGTNKVLTASTTITAGAVTVASNSFTVTHAAASQIAFATQPGGGTSAVAWSTQPVVEVRDAQGNLVTTGADATRTITVALTTGMGALTGTLTKTAVGGVADFSANALKVDLIGTNKVLTASTTITAGAVTVASSSFTVSSAAASQIVFTTQPGGGTSAIAWGTQPIIEIRDAQGNLVTTGADATRTITVALTTGTGTLTGTLTKAAVAGVADFSANALKIDLIGTNKVLTASTTITAGAVTVASNSFTVSSGAASQIAFATQPGGGTAGVAWSTQPIVEIRDAQGNLITTGADATRTITVALTTGTGALTGTLSKTAVGGVADFSANALKIDLSGTNKVLTASTTITAGAVSQNSNAFTVTHAAASQIAVTAVSSSTVALIPFASQPIVTIQDAFGNTVTTGADATAAITLSLQQGTGSLAGTSLSMSAVAGVADFAGKGLTGLYKIINSKIYQASSGFPGSTTVLDLVYNSSTAKVYFGASGIYSFTPTSSNAGDESATSVLSGTVASATCNADGIAAASACIVPDSLFLLSGNQLAWTEGYTNAPGLYRVRTLDSTTNTVQTLAGTLPFSGDGQSQSVTKYGAVWTLKYNQNTTYHPAGLYFADGGAGIIGYLASGSAHVKGGNQISKFIAAGDTFGPGSYAGRITNGYGPMSYLSFAPSGLLTYQSDQNWLSYIDASSKIQSIMMNGTGSGQFFQNASDGVAASTLNLNQNGSQGHMVYDANSNLYFGTGSSASCTGTCATTRKIGMVTSGGTYYKVIGNTTSGYSADNATPGAISNLTVNCGTPSECQISETFDNRYNSNAGRLFFSEQNNLRYIGSPSSSAASTLGTLFAAGRPVYASVVRYVNPSDTTNAAIDRVYYLTGNKLYCYKISAGTSTNCDNTSLGPPSPMTGTYNYTLTDDGTNLYMMDSTQTIIYKYTPLP